jgi:putative flavoprotein involved in K+ transport
MSARQATRRAGSVDVVVVGAGHAGLSMSYELGRRSIGHVVLERGEVANTWRHERWNSLRLLTPNWMSRLPGLCYAGDDPDGYMTAADVAAFVSTYAQRTAAPVLCGHTVSRVEGAGDGYRVVTDRGDWYCRALVAATGPCNDPCLPALAAGVPSHIRQLTARDYRGPEQLTEGGVLVVGASATGVQLAEEIHASGRPVTLAVGEHVRMPRTYRGRDIQWWMLSAGLLDQRIEDVDDPIRARGVPSPQLIGTPERRTLGLNELRTQGVEIVGRLAGLRDGQAQFSGSLANVCALADLKMKRMLTAIDGWATANGLADGCAEDFAATDIGWPRLGLNLHSGQVRTVLWATGFRADFEWLALPVFDRRGRLRHAAGVIDAPGLYVLGLPFLRRRKSSFIHGTGDDAREIGAHLAAYLDRTTRLRVAGCAL